VPKLRQFILFTLVGGFAAAVNIVARMLFSLVASYEIAIVLAFPIALTTAFVLNRRFVFPSSKGPAAPQYVRFLLVNLVALVQVLLVSVALARYLLPAVGMVAEAETVGHVVGVLSTVLTSFVFHKAYTFAAPPLSSREGTAAGGLR
jgi:putative flippase GtrA